MNEPSSICPNCGQALSPLKIRGAAFKGCEACRSTLLKQSGLIPALEALSADVLESSDPDAQLVALPDRSAQLPCPSCRRAMERADYCDAKLVFFDRCNSCALLWIGSEELGAMSLMWARMEKRIARTRAQNEEILSGLDALLDAAHFRRVIEGSLWRGPLERDSLSAWFRLLE